MSHSLIDVARLAGVSIASASRVINGSRHPVSPELRQRVLLASASVGYVASPLARALVSKRAPIIGVIVGDVVDPFFAEIARGVEDATREAHFLTILCDADRRSSTEIAYLRLLRDYNAAGVIFAGGGSVDEPRLSELTETVAELRSRGVRVVSLAERGFGGAHVTIDNFRAAFDMTDYLIRLGHRRIAFVGGIRSVTTSIARMEGFRAAMRTAELPSDLSYDGDYRFESGQRAALRMLSGDAPHAVLAANDESAIGVLLGLRTAGVQVPQQISVAGIGGTRASELVDLSTVSVAMYQTGVIAAQKIVDKDGWDPDMHIVLLHRLLPRGTTGVRS